MVSERSRAASERLHAVSERPHAMSERPRPVSERSHAVSERLYAVSSRLQQGSRSHVAVVGGGIAGLAAADTLVRGGARVTLLEADARLGGKIRSETIDGQTIEVGAESLMTYNRVALELCQALGLEPELTGAQRTDTSIWAAGRLRDLPPGILSGLPDGVGPLLRTGILPPLGVARASLDLILPSRRPDRGDCSVGELVSRRLGRSALDRLVDPLLGTIYAADSERLSLQATAPQLDALARRHRSLIRGLRAAKPSPPSGGPMFVTLPGGLQRIVSRLEKRLMAAEIRRGTRAQLLEPVVEGGYRLLLDGGERLPVDAALIAAPADEAGHILEALSPTVAGELRCIGYVPVVVVVLAYDAGSQTWPSGAGFLVPRSERRLLGACTWLSNKWPHLAASGKLWLRCSVARSSVARALALEDEQLVGAIAAELREAGLAGAPVSAHVTRWERALPVYEPGHLDRVARIERGLERLPRVALAGAAYRGIGAPQCIAQAQDAARRLLAALGDGDRAHAL